MRSISLKFKVFSFEAVILGVRRDLLLIESRLGSSGAAKNREFNHILVAKGELDQ